MSSYSDEGYDQIARVLREELGIDDDIQLDVIDALRRMKYQGYLRDFICLPDGDLPDAEAKFIAEERRIYLRDTIFKEPPSSRMGSLTHASLVRSRRSAHGVASECGYRSNQPTKSSPGIAQIWIGPSVPRR